MSDCIVCDSTTHTCLVHGQQTKLSDSELKAWRRWRPNDTVRDVVSMRERSGKYPLIQGGIT